MKTLFKSLFLFLFLFPLTAFSQNDTLRVLAIGNSFSIDASDQHLYSVAKAGGTTLIIGNMYIGGCSLERHFNNSRSDSRDYWYFKYDSEGRHSVTTGYTLSRAIADEPWDIVTLQQSSPLSGKYDSYEPYLEEMISYVRSKIGRDVKIMFHQTWAYASFSDHPNFPDYDCNRELMYDSIRLASATACGKYGLQVIPSGTAIENFARSYLGDGKYTRDGYHLNYTFGRYAASCAWYEALTGKSVIGNGYLPANVSEKLRDALQQAAHLACDRPFQYTPLQLKERYMNEAESEVPQYTLPDALVCNDGAKVRNSRQWAKKRRGEILELFENEMFGVAPGRPGEMHFKVLSDNLTDSMRRKKVAVYFDRKEKYCMNMLVLLPKDAKGPVPAFLGMNFSKSADDIERYDVEKILSAGYAAVTFRREEIDPDYYDAFSNGIFPLFYKEGQSYPEMNGWGTISAWAWGLSRALDYLETDPDIDAHKVAVIGHSRLGKTALWAGAKDERFALVISNDSGCGGAALSRRCFGENVELITDAFPHWFCGNFFKYACNEASLPFDQHELIALVAPRPVYVASASEDLWADPKGEFLSAKYASEVYRLFGYEGISANAEMPAAGGQTGGDRVAYHLRPGTHNLTPYDWERFIAFADKYLK